MPNRIIKESICRSDTINSLSCFEEVLFYRLIVACDDYGRFDGRPSVIKGYCFPLKDTSVKDIEAALAKLVGTGLVQMYEVQGKPVLQLSTWSRHQQVRAKKSKYPSPDESCGHINTCDIEIWQSTSLDRNGNHLISDDCNSPRNRNRNTRIENRESECGDDVRMRETITAQHFEEFWAAYPKKKRRHPAEKEYCDLILSGAATEEILIKAARNYAEHCKSLESEQYIKHADNFLRECVFEDYLEEKNSEAPKKEESKPEEELVGEGEEWWRYGPNAWED